MAEAALRLDLDYEPSDSPSPKRRNMNSSEGNSALEARWQSKLDKLADTFSAKFDRLAEMLAAKTQDKTETGTSGARRPSASAGTSKSREDDTISLQPGQDEMENLGVRSLFGDSESDTSSESMVGNDNNNNNGQTDLVYVRSKSLRDIFGEEAGISSREEENGIVLDKSQIDILSKSWHSLHPDNLTAYREEYRSNFPVSDSSNEVLSVPSLDSIIENLLINRYGSRAASSGHKVALFSNPVKSLEKLAYQGQLAARYGIITTAYLQQALGSLLEELKKKEVNMDKAVQTVRDIFAISTKSLDQIARAGAYHHLVRRKAAQEDTGLNDVKEIRNQISDLPT